MKLSRECILTNEPVEKRPLAITLAVTGLHTILAVVVFIIGFTGYVIGESHGRRDGYDHGLATGDFNCHPTRPNEWTGSWWGTDETIR